MSHFYHHKSPSWSLFIARPSHSSLRSFRSGCAQGSRPLHPVLDIAISPDAFEPFPHSYAQVSHIIKMTIRALTRVADCFF